MPHPRRHGTLPDDDEDKAPSPRLASSSWGCYGFFLGAPGRRGYRRLDPAARAVRVEVVGMTGKKEAAAARSVAFDVDAAVMEAEPVRSLVAVAGRRVRGGDVAVAVDAMLFEHVLWLAATTDDGGGGGSAADLSEIVDFYSHDDDDGGDGHGLKC